MGSILFAIALIACGTEASSASRSQAASGEAWLSNLTNDKLAQACPVGYTAKRTGAWLQISEQRATSAGRLPAKAAAKKPDGCDCGDCQCDPCVCHLIDCKYDKALRWAKEGGEAYLVVGVPDKVLEKYDWEQYCRKRSAALAVEEKTPRFGIFDRGVYQFEQNDKGKATLRMVNKLACFGPGDCRLVNVAD